MFMAVVVLAVAGGGLAYKVKEESPMYICYTTDLSGDHHLCNVVYPTTIGFEEPRDSLRVLLYDCG